VAVPLQSGAGHGGPQADLGRHPTPVSTQRAVPQCLVDPLARQVNGGRDVGQREQRSERVGSHPPTLAAGR